jgi:hypothetical protein
MGEQEVFSETSGWTFSHEDTNTKIDHLAIKLTSHRLTLFHPTNRQFFNFEFFFENLRKFEVIVRASVETFRKEDGLERLLTRLICI